MHAVSRSSFVPVFVCFVPFVVHRLRDKQKVVE